ncbi:MAG: alanyl-tRNA editing protein [Clostridia bacterium]
MSERIYYNDQYQKLLNTKIIESGFINNKPFVVLEETIFYPEGGGQPADSGNINGILVCDVQEIDGKIVHFLEKAVNAKVAVCCLDWDKRLDHMQQHTGQHILSGVAYELFKAQTVGFHLGSSDTTVDLSKGNLNKEELDLIERKANQIVSNNYKIETFFPDDSEIKQLNLRKKPNNYEQVRIVNVKNLDYSPCGGTHFNSTSEVGVIKIIGVERIRGNTRVHILCGNRAYLDYKEKTDIISNLIEITNSPQNELLSSVESIYKENKDKNKELNILKEELAISVANNYLQRATSYKDISLLIFSNNDFDSLQFRAIANYMIDKENILGFIFSEVNGSFVLFKSKSLDIKLRELFNHLKVSIGCKGGGNNYLIQGKCTNHDLENIKTIISKFLT